MANCALRATVNTLIGGLGLDVPTDLHSRLPANASEDDVANVLRDFGVAAVSTQTLDAYDMCENLEVFGADVGAYNTFVNEFANGEDRVAGIVVRSGAALMGHFSSLIVRVNGGEVYVDVRESHLAFHLEDARRAALAVHRHVLAVLPAPLATASTAPGSTGSNAVGTSDVFHFATSRFVKSVDGVYGDRGGEDDHDARSYIEAGDIVSRDVVKPVNDAVVTDPSTSIGTVVAAVSDVSMGSGDDAPCVEFDQLTLRSDEPTGPSGVP